VRGAAQGASHGPPSCLPQRRAGVSSLFGIETPLLPTHYSPFQYAPLTILHFAPRAATKRRKRTRRAPLLFVCLYFSSLSMPFEQFVESLLPVDESHIDLNKFSLQVLQAHH